MTKTCTLPACFGVVLAITVFSADTSHAWWPVAHYIIAEELGVDPAYSNLPDAWPSDWLYMSITEKFCWTHGLQDNYLPAAPTYPEDGRWPEYDMRILAKYKLKNPSATANKTVEGFAVHNGADRIVHYAYFQGGPGMPPEIWSVWLSHARKERWADYVVFAWKKANATFDNDGELVDPGVVFGADGKVLPALVFQTNVTGDAQLLHLAQKVYRKNGRKTDADGTGVLNVDSAQDVTDRIAWFNNNYGNVVAGFCQRIADGSHSWEQMHAYAVENGWTVTTCMATYNTAKAKAQSRLTFVRGM